MDGQTRFALLPKKLNILMEKNGKILFFIFDQGQRNFLLLGWANIRHILFIRIMNNFGLLFEYSNNIPIFILLNKLPILAKIS
jgi:hypothetical protein